VHIKEESGVSSGGVDLHQVSVSYETNPGLLKYPTGMEDYYLNIFDATDAGISDFFDLGGGQDDVNISNVLFGASNESQQNVGGTGEAGGEEEVDRGLVW